MTVKQRAAEARRLLADEAFKSVIEEIRGDAVSFFLTVDCDINQIADAHARVRATQIILDALQARIDAEAVADKKDQDRGYD